jgi:hypothetical protein
VEGGGDDCFLGAEALVRKRMESKGRRRKKKQARSWRNSIITVWTPLFDLISFRLVFLSVEGC